MMELLPELTMIPSLSPPFFNLLPSSVLTATYQTSPKSNGRSSHGSSDVLEKDEKLCDYYRRMPVLYDKSHPHYKFQSKKEKAWRELSRLCEMDVEQCKKRMTYFRCRFTVERRIMKNGVNCSEWPLLEKLKFLNKHIKIRRPRAPNGEPDDTDDETNPMNILRKRQREQQEDAKDDLHTYLDLQQMAVAAQNTQAQLHYQQHLKLQGHGPFGAPPGAGGFPSAHDPMSLHHLQPPHPHQRDHQLPPPHSNQPGGGGSQQGLPPGQQQVPHSNPPSSMARVRALTDITTSNRHRSSRRYRQRCRTSRYRTACRNGPVSATTETRRPCRTSTSTAPSSTRTISSTRPTWTSTARTVCTSGRCCANCPSGYRRSPRSRSCSCCTRRRCSRSMPHRPPPPHPSPARHRARLPTGSRATERQGVALPLPPPPAVCRTVVALPAWPRPRAAASRRRAPSRRATKTRLRPSRPLPLAHHHHLPLPLQRRLVHWCTGGSERGHPSSPRAAGQRTTRKERDTHDLPFPLALHVALIINFSVATPHQTPLIISPHQPSYCCIDNVAKILLLGIKTD